MNAALPMWDELDMEKYTERDLLIRSLREAIADITISTTHVQTAYTRLHTLQQEYTNRLAIIRNDTLLLRLTPLKTLIPHLERAIATNTLPQGQNIHLEVVGDTIEIDRDILETLAGPLSQMLATCIDDLSFVQQDPQSAETPPTSSPQIWLHASSIGHDVTLEIGFSMTIQGGAIANIRNTIQDLNGTISSQRNNKGGISFVLHIPRSQGSLQGFLVRIGQQYLLAPISQIHRVDDMTNTRLDMTYHLEDLLGFTKDEPETRSAKTGLLPQLQPVLLLQRETSRKTIGIIVDEVIGEIELVVKPLLPFLQRPGILGSAVDGKGRILLVLDMYGLVRHYAYRDLQQENAEKNPVPSTPHRRQATILVADDSVFLRQSVLQTLHHEKYHVIEAKDGLEALEQLLDHTPDVFLLDIEMPNLNGYDVLSIMQLYPEFSHIKIIMLTSRSSEKHIQRARDLGAHAYLTKPVPQETLLGTVQRMLAQQEVKKTPETDPPE
jgi:chemosensory pili system protein ChpA (sensor histidine kinase/response regulator)